MRWHGRACCMAACHEDRRAAESGAEPVVTGMRMNSNAAPGLTLPLCIEHDGEQYRAALCLARMSLPQLFSEQQSRAYLHPGEQAQLHLYTSPLRRHSYLLGRYCAKRALALQLGFDDPQGILVQAGVFGQPVPRTIAGADTRISISHSEDRGCALAFDAAMPMGIDLEIESSRHDDILRSQLCPAELYRLEREWPQPQVCTGLWTAREALGKALGTGLTMSPWIYEICSVEREGIYLVARFRHLPQYKSLSFRWENALVSIALPVRCVVGGISKIYAESVGIVAHDSG